MNKGVRGKPLRYAAVLLLTFALCLQLFFLGYRYDNKYTQPAHPAQMGITLLDAAQYESRPLLYLADGWAFYPGLYSPREISRSGVTPSAYFYLGRYGGFDLGDANAPRHGERTYRMTIFTGSDRPREYALELTQIYSRWSLWINGELKQCVGMPHDEQPPAPQSWIVTFTATDTVEIVVAVADENGLYSGMVYPPAFGSPQAVGRQLVTRLVIHCVPMAAALLLGLLCLLVGMNLGFSRPYAGMFLLCLCFAAYTAYPLFQALGLYGGGVTLLERLCYYGILLCIIWMQGRMTGLPKRAYCTAAAIAFTVCLLVLLQSLIHFEKAGAYYLFGRMLEIYKWLAAAYLLITGIWAVQKNHPGSKALLCGFIVFAAALTADRLWPMYEPIYLGWPQELAGFVLILIIVALLWRDTVAVYRDSLLVAERNRQAELELEASRRYSALQQDYVRRSGRQLHETRNNLLVLRHYALEQERDSLLACLGRLLQVSSITAVSYSDNALLDAILHVQLTRAAELDIYVEYTLKDILSRLPLEDGDLTSLVMNVLDNAIAAAAAADEKWLYFSLEWSAEQSLLHLDCGNSKAPEPAKNKGHGHGYGLSIIREIADRYNGAAVTREETDNYHIEVCMHLNSISPR